MDTGYVLITLTFAVAAVALLLGLVIVREGPRQRLNWVTAGMLFFGGAGALLGVGDFVVALRESKALEAQGGLIRSFAYTWEFFFPIFLLFTLHFPRERRIVRRFPWLNWVLFLPYVFHFLLLTLGAGSEGRFEFETLATRSPGLVPIARFLDITVFLSYQLNATLYPLVNLAVIIAATWLLISAYRQAQNPRLRVQMRIVLIGLIGCVGLYTIAVPVPVLSGHDVGPLVRSTLVVAGLLIGSLSIAYAIVRHRFLDARMLARRSILYGAATAILLGIYITLIRRVNSAVAGLIGLDAEYIQTAVLVVSLLLFQPLLSRLEEWLESLMLRDRADYRNVIRGLSRDVTTVLDLGDLGAKVGEMLGRSLMVDSGLLLVRPAPGAPLERAATFGQVAFSDRLIAAIERGLEHSPPRDLMDADELLAGSDEVPPIQLLLVPLRHSGELLGLLLLGAKITGTGFNAEDRGLLATLGDQIGVAIKNSHLHRESIAKTLLEEELSFARRVQQSFLPDEFPPMPPLDVWARNIPSKFVSGDYFDVVPLAADEVLFAIGDVSGKGVPAALLMSMLRAALRTQARERGSLSEMMAALNSLIHESTSAREFVTLFLARVDCQRLKLTYSNGGHNPPLLRRGDGGGIEQLDRGGLLLGAYDGAVFEEGEVDLRAEDVVVLYTDGLTEATRADGDMYGDERLESEVRRLDPGASARESLNRLEAACRGWTNGAELEDDLTMLLLRVTGGHPAAGEVGVADSLALR